jgi:hypothetical protein
MAEQRGKNYYKHVVGHTINDYLDTVLGKVTVLDRENLSELDVHKQAVEEGRANLDSKMLGFYEGALESIKFEGLDPETPNGQEAARIAALLFISQLAARAIVARTMPWLNESYAKPSEKAIPAMDAVAAIEYERLVIGFAKMYPESSIVTLPLYKDAAATVEELASLKPGEPRWVSRNYNTRNGPTG